MAIYVFSFEVNFVKRRKNLNISQIEIGRPKCGMEEKRGTESKERKRIFNLSANNFSIHTKAFVPGEIVYVANFIYIYLHIYLSSEQPKMSSINDLK